MSLAITNIFPFSDTAIENAPDILKGLSVADWLKGEYTRHNFYGLDNLKRYGYYKLAGWLYQFNMPKFLVKQYGEWHEYYAPNKTCLRNALFGRIEKIIELEA